MTSQIFYWIMALPLTFFLLLKVFRYGIRLKTSPPGPPTLPVLGNLLQLPQKDLHLYFDKLSKQYGPIVSLKLGGTDLVLLNDATVVRDLIEKRSSIYSARPDTFIREFVGNRNIAFRNNDDTWRRQRKMYHLRLNTKVANQYIPYQVFDSKQLMSDLLNDPDQYVKHLQRYTTSVASTVLYGMRTSTSDNGYVKDLMDWMEKTSDAQNFQLVDFYNFLRPLYRIMPARFSSLKTQLLEINAIENRLFFSLLNVAKENIAKGKVYPSFIRDMLLADEKDLMSDVEIANNAAHGFGAATDTQWNTALGFVKAMVLHPKVQQEAQQEIDKVVGSDRMPEWEDRENLPYIRGIVEESLRWMPTTLTAAVPHCVTRDDVYNGYTIPEGAIIMMNVWTLNNNDETNENPRDFNPSRHSAEFTATESNSISPEATKRSNFTFGAGRRVCPGFHVAQRGLFIAISRMLWGFQFSRPKDASGEFIAIDRDAVTPGLIVQPAPFPCNIQPRDEKRAAIIAAAWEEAQIDLDEEGNFTEEFFEKVFPGK
ncbi:cytochrome P450 [Leptodontidium sp. MPI-SDFR-AT-0119]|nr:cytochrome P450 [Leptodontidium sp. MPI-SDFR-AT-0119]